MALAPARQRLVDLMNRTLQDEAFYHDWTYRAVRPMPVPRSWTRGQKVVGDCSKGVQYLCRWAGAPDPMANGWSDWGNSQTIWITLAHVWAPEELEPGDIVVFGQDGQDHAAMVLLAGVDPLLWSFGRQGSPDTYRLSQDLRPKTYCKLPIADPPPTPQEKLRAMTGFYSWVAWKLGEGPWKKYGKANKTVRPNVPRRIPLNWWKRLVLFLANRKKGN